MIKHGKRVGLPLAKRADVPEEAWENMFYKFRDFKVLIVLASRVQCCRQSMTHETISIPNKMRGRSTLTRLFITSIV